MTLPTPHIFLESFKSYLGVSMLAMVLKEFKFTRYWVGCHSLFLFSVITTSAIAGISTLPDAMHTAWGIGTYAVTVSLLLTLLLSALIVYGIYQKKAIGLYASYSYVLVALMLNILLTLPYSLPLKITGWILTLLVLSGLVRQIYHERDYYERPH